MIEKQETRADGIARVGSADSTVELVNDAAGVRLDAGPAASPLMAPSADAQRTTAGYLASADRTAVLMGTAWKVFVAIAVLVLAAWAAGILPGAARLF